MKSYTDANKGNRDEMLRKNWREDKCVRRKKKDIPNKKSYRRKLKKIKEI
jgi:hypothetical protein